MLRLPSRDSYQTVYARALALCSIARKRKHDSVETRVQQQLELEQKVVQGIAWILWSFPWSWKPRAGSRRLARSAGFVQPAGAR